MDLGIVMGLGVKFLKKIWAEATLKQGVSSIYDLRHFSVSGANAGASSYRSRSFSLSLKMNLGQINCSRENRVFSHQ